MITDHPLLEVRSRTLQSVVFKLNNGLISPADLVHEKAFLAGLLEWFNFEEWALESQVLGLIAQLVEVGVDLAGNNLNCDVGSESPSYM